MSENSMDERSAIIGEKEIAPPEKHLPNAGIGWLIERYTNSRLEYWTGRISSEGISYWDERAHEAVRFCRQQDASVVLSWVFKGNGRAVAHAWMQPSQPEPLSSGNQSVVDARARALMDGCSMPYEQALELAISESEK